MSVSRCSGVVVDVVWIVTSLILAAGIDSRFLLDRKEVQTLGAQTAYLNWRPFDVT